MTTRELEAIRLVRLVHEGKDHNEALLQVFNDLVRKNGVDGAFALATVLARISYRMSVAAVRSRGETSWTENAKGHRVMLCGVGETQRRLPLGALRHATHSSPGTWIAPVAEAGAHAGTSLPSRPC
jgi:hypothetical protein